MTDIVDRNERENSTRKKETETRMEKRDSKAENGEFYRNYHSVLRRQTTYYKEILMSRKNNRFSR